MNNSRDHGGGLDAAMVQYGGTRADWLDLSTGINPVPFPTGEISENAWNALPDHRAQDSLIKAARIFWNVPKEAAILAAPGASSLIARTPLLAPQGAVSIPAPTYNEHAAAFTANGWTVGGEGQDAQVLVHPNNPGGHLWNATDITAPLAIIDESFCDICPEASLINQATRKGTLILKSFGKFWGLAGLRLGFAIGDPVLIEHLRDALGPWPVAGPALEIGARALSDHNWADQTRKRLAQDAAHLDKIMAAKGAEIVGGTSLFRLYHVDDAQEWQAHLARAHIWSRVFPYSKNWLRLGLPAPKGWTQLEAAL